MSWQFKIGAGSLQTGVQSGIESVSGTYQSRGIDRFTLMALPAVNPAYGTMIEVWNGGVRRFLGRVQTAPLVRSGNSKRRRINLVGPQWWLTRITYKQTWSIYYFPSTIGPQPSSRIVLNQDATGANISVESQIHAIVDYATAAGAPIQFGLATVGMTLPLDEQRDLSCDQALQRVLRLSPDVCSWIDYAAATPTIYFGHGSQITVPASIESDDVVERNDLVVPGLTIQIERINTFNGRSYRSIETQTAGTTSALEAIWATLQLAGSDVNQTQLTCAVVTESVPFPFSNATWWTANHPRLANIAAGDISFVSSDRLFNGASIADGVSYPNVSKTSISDLTSLGLHCRVEQWKAVVNINHRDGNGQIDDTETGVALEMDVITTDATTQTYNVVTSFNNTAPEPCPSDLAAALYAHWSVLYSQGTAQWPLALLWPVPGTLYTTTTPIQVVRVDSLRQTADADFGPPQHLELSDWASRLQGFRTRRASYFFNMRTNAGAAQGGSLGSNPITPAKSSGASPGTKTLLTLEATSSESLLQKINLNPAAVAHANSGDRTSRILQPREMWIPYQNPSTGAWMAKLCQVLCSDLYDTGVSLAGLAVNPGASVATLGANSLGYESADGSTWTAGGSNGLVLWVETRQRYYAASAKVWYAYARAFTFDNTGKLYSVSGETRFTVETPEST